MSKEPCALLFKTVVAIVVLPTIVLHTASQILLLLLFPSSSETHVQPTTEYTDTTATSGAGTHVTCLQFQNLCNEPDSAEV